MTRKSKREIERAVDDLTGGDADSLEGYDALVAYRTADGWVDTDGQRLPPDATVAMGRAATVERETAEAEGWIILGEADTADPGYVTVPWDHGDREVPV